ncbi:MAG: histidine phosphatase family protein, partial [Alphaproteobacteria bacterium]|nr:histidine phosphatase family protein [Alphaproteobacteria bacterium]
MFELLLLRHAKSSWAESGQNDTDRPLNDRGREAARLMGRTIAAQGMLPGRVLCS